MSASSMRRAHLTLIAEALLVASIAVAIRLVNLDHNGNYDEFYHVLAAQSYAATGTPAIADGVYARALVFTQIVAAFMSTFGDELWAARLPAVLGGAIWVLASFLIVRTEASRVAGWIAALLLCFDSLTIYLSQLVRFYSLHGAAFLIGSYLFYRSVSEWFDQRRVGRATLLALASCAVLALAAHLQAVTLVGGLGLAVWFVLELTGRVAERWKGVWVWLGLAGVGLVCVGLFALHEASTGWLASLRTAPVWLDRDADSPLFYYRLWRDQLPVFSAALPIALLAAATRYGRFGRLCVVVLATALVVHSIAAAKEERYVAYLLPYFYAVIGMGAASLWESSQAALASRLGRPASGVLRLLCIAFATAVALNATLANPRFVETIRNIAKDPPGGRYQSSDWEGAARDLRELVASSDVVIASAGVKALFFMGRLDYDLLRTVQAETDTGEDFGMDLRIGRPVISSAEALRTVVESASSGLVLVENGHWREDPYVPDETADYLEQHLQAIPLPDHRIHAFYWHRGAEDLRGSSAVPAVRPPNLP